MISEKKLKQHFQLFHPFLLYIFLQNRLFSGALATISAISADFVAGTSYLKLNFSDFGNNLGCFSYFCCFGCFYPRFSKMTNYKALSRLYWVIAFVLTHSGDTRRSPKYIAHAAAGSL